MSEKCGTDTNVKQCVIEELECRLSSLSFVQAVVENARVTLHCVGFVEQSIHQVVGVVVLLDELVQGDA